MTKYLHAKIKLNYCSSQTYRQQSAHGSDTMTTPPLTQYLQNMSEYPTYSDEGDTYYDILDERLAEQLNIWSCYEGLVQDELEKKRTKTNDKEIKVPMF